MKYDDDEQRRAERQAAFRDIAEMQLQMTMDTIRTTDPSYVSGRPPVPYEDLTEEQAYARRNAAVVLAVSLAMSLGWPAGFRFDPDATRPIEAYIELPGVRQVSWHLPAYAGTYDGHTTLAKYERISEWMEEVDRRADVRRKNAVLGRGFLAAPDADGVLQKIADL